MILKLDMFTKLEKEAKIYTFDVSSATIYELSFFIFSAEEEMKHNACLMFFDFDGKTLNDETVRLNRLSVSPHIGYFRYIEVSPEGRNVNKKLLIPRGVKTLTVGFMLWQNSSDIFIGKHILFEPVSIDKMSIKQKEIRQQMSHHAFHKEIAYCETLYEQKDIDLLANAIVAMEHKFAEKLPELYHRIYQFYVVRDYNKAVFYAQKSLVLNPDNEVLRMSLFRIYLRQGSFKKAFMVLETHDMLPLGSLKKEKLEKFCRRLSEESLICVIDHLIETFPHEEGRLSRLAFTLLKDIYPSLAISYGRQYAMMYPEEEKFTQVLLRRMEKMKMYDEMFSLAKTLTLYTDNAELRYILFRAEIKPQIDKCETFYNEGKNDILEETVRRLEKKYISNQFNLNKILFRFYLEKSYEKAKMYLERALRVKYDEGLLRDMYDLHMRYGHIRKALSAIPENATLPALKIKQKTGGSLLHLLEKGFLPSFAKTVEQYIPNKKKIFYLLHNRLPYDSGGYATRSHGLLGGIQSLGWDIHGVSRLGYPEDKKEEIVPQETDWVDGVPYHRLHHEGIGLGSLPMEEYLVAYAKRLLVFAQQEKPAIIHAASNHMNGLVAHYVAKILGIKSIYEVRGLWEITRISRQPEWEGTDYFDLMVKLEAQAAKEADVVLTITQALKDEMIRRGVEGEKIHIIPNGVKSDRFQPRERDKDLENRLGVKKKVVIGYIGSVVSYEGLEYLVDAISILDKKIRKQIRVLIVGDGAVLDKIQERVKELKLEKYFIFTGRVPHDEVESYYSLVDITPFPRKGQPVCEMVSPLKPFEAMAMGKAVLVSDVAALTEIVKDGYNGIVFTKDNVKELSEKLSMLIVNDKQRKKLGKQAQEWVKKERDWRVISQKVDHIYHGLES